MKKLGLGERIRERLAPGWRERRMRERREQGPVIEEIAAEFTTEELQEFLEADLHPVEADPDFKEELRQRLWRMVQSRRAGQGDDFDA